MLVIRATRRLAQHVGAELISAPPPASTGNLGDWFGNWLPTSLGPVVVLMNGITRLAILSTARSPEQLVNDLHDHLSRVLDTLGVPDDAAKTEIKAMSPVVFAKTNDRRFVGSLTEICRMVATHDEDASLSMPNGLVDVEDWLTELVHLNLPETHPADAVRARLGGMDPRLH